MYEFYDKSFQRDVLYNIYSFRSRLRCFIHLYLTGVEKTWLSRHFIKKKKNILIGVPPGVSLFTPLPGWMLRQEQWRLTWLAVPPLYFPLPSSRSSGASRRTCCPFPSSIVSVSSLRGTRALAARARPGVCLSLEKHGGKHAPRAPEKKSILRWPSSQVYDCDR